MRAEGGSESGAVCVLLSPEFQDRKLASRAPVWEKRSQRARLHRLEDQLYFHLETSSERQGICRCLDRADSPHLPAGSAEHRDGGGVTTGFRQRVSQVCPGGDTVLTPEELVVANHCECTKH